jgi:hypothetical protein
MKPNSFFTLRSLSLIPLSLAVVTAQTPAPQTATPPPVSYTSASQLNQLLSQLEQTAQTTQVDLAKLRIEKWKTDANQKQQMLADVGSIERNLRGALPEIIGQLRAAPENLTSTFKLYRNLDALYDVLGTVVESAGAFGPKDDFQMLENDLNALERSRRTLADRMETLSGAKEVEITRLRSQLQSTEAAAKPPQPPKKVVVDDNEPAKKPVKKKSASTKPPATTTPQTVPPPPPPQ